MALLKNKKYDFNLFFKNALKVLLLVFISVSMILSFVNTIKSYKKDNNSSHEILTLHRYDKGLYRSNDSNSTPLSLSIGDNVVYPIYFNINVSYEDIVSLASSLSNGLYRYYYVSNTSAYSTSYVVSLNFQKNTSGCKFYCEAVYNNGYETSYTFLDSSGWHSWFFFDSTTGVLDNADNSSISTTSLATDSRLSVLNNVVSTTPFYENTLAIDISNQTWLFAKDTFINNVDLVKPFLAVSSDDRNLYYDKAYFSFNDTYSLGNPSSSSVWGYDLMGFSSDTGFTIFYDNKELELYNSATNKVIDSMYNYYITFAPNTYVWYGAFDDMPRNSEDSFYIAFLDIQEDFEPSLEIYEYLTSNIFRVTDSLTTLVEASTRTYNYNDSEVPNFIFDFTFGSNGQTFFGINRFNNNLSYKLIDGSYLQVMANNVWVDYAYQVITYDTQNVSFYTEDALYKTFGLGGNQRQYRVSGWYTFNLVPDVSSIFDSSGFWYYEKPFLSNNTSYSGFSIEYYTDSLITRIRYLNSATGTYELVYDSNGWVSDNYRYLFLGNVIVSSNTYFDLLSTGLYGYISTNSFDTTLPDLFFTIADVPIYTLSQLLSFELFGTQLFIAFSSIITLILVVYVIRKLI